jgi:hypothetical protein
MTSNSLEKEGVNLMTMGYEGKHGSCLTLLRCKTEDGVDWILNSTKSQGIIRLVTNL